MKNPLLSVCLITYNHVNYINKAIESVLMQKVEFPFELIIADDFSTDGTREIVLEYKKKNPDFIKLILQEINVGPAKNWLDLITTPKSKYIAYFEGDDYWTDPLKLQKQIDCLEKNTQYAGCFHDGLAIDTKGEIVKENMVKIKRTVTQEDIITYGAIFPSASIVYRANTIDDYMILPKIYGGDRWLFMQITDRGDLAYLPDKMCVYRVHSFGLWSGATELIKAERLYSDFRHYYSIKKYSIRYGNIIRQKMCENLSVMASEYFYHKKFKKYFFAALHYIRYMPLSIFNIKRMFSHIFFPSLYRLYKNRFKN